MTPGHPGDSTPPWVTSWGSDPAPGATARVTTFKSFHNVRTKNHVNLTLMRQLYFCISAPSVSCIQDGYKFAGQELDYLGESPYPLRGLATWEECQAECKKIPMWVENLSWFKGIIFINTVSTTVFHCFCNPLLFPFLWKRNWFELHGNLF